MFIIVGNKSEPAQSLPYQLIT